MTTLYDVSVGVLSKIITVETEILKKAEAWATEKEIPMEDLLSARLHEDMLPLSRQPMIITRMASMIIQRLTGAKLPEVAIQEATLAEIYRALADTLNMLTDIDPETVNGKKDEKAQTKAGPWEVDMTALELTQSFVVPNAWFHLTTTYDILRMKGVPLGKRDFIMQFMKKHV
ncbi:hypothetical protein GGR56DRAFT_657051 [Xylariaceae sp. FL0804]|nr:hypothetical protein GGR56DRAFT_657051 [Xylariaceae sp. FL0804]